MSDPAEFPAWIRWKRRGGADLRQPEGRGPNGRRLCRWCASEVPAGRQSWCSEPCVSRGLQVLGWRQLREFIIARDKVCNRCGTDWPGWKQTRSYDWTSVRDGGRWYQSKSTTLFPWWEVDHITRIIDGGTDDPANLRLLCHACHVAVGYEQRAAAKERAA